KEGKETSRELQHDNANTQNALNVRERQAQPIGSSFLLHARARGSIEESAKSFPLRHHLIDLLCNGLLFGGELCELGPVTPGIFFELCTHLGELLFACSNEVFELLHASLLFFTIARCCLLRFMLLPRISGGDLWLGLLRRSARRRRLRCRTQGR